MESLLSCRDEILISVGAVINRKALNEFTVKEILDEMVENETTYKESTIRTHIISRCCVNSSNHHVTVYEVFKEYEGAYIRCYRKGLISRNEVSE